MEYASEWGDLSPLYGGLFPKQIFTDPGPLLSLCKLHGDYCRPRCASDPIDQCCSGSGRKNLFWQWSGDSRWVVSSFLPSPQFLQDACPQKGISPIPSWQLCSIIMFFNNTDGIQYLSSEDLSSALQRELRERWVKIYIVKCLVLDASVFGWLIGEI